jgi:hypothetical protein
MKPVAEMTEPEKAQVRAWIKNWQEVGLILEAEKRKAIRRVNTAEAIASLELAYKSARLHCKRRQTSGLIEQQQWFKRGHR